MARPRLVEVRVAPAPPPGAARDWLLSARSPLGIAAGWRGPGLGRQRRRGRWWLCREAGEFLGGGGGGGVGARSARGTGLGLRRPLWRAGGAGRGRRARAETRGPPGPPRAAAPSSARHVPAPGPSLQQACPGASPPPCLSGLPGSRWGRVRTRGPLSSPPAPTWDPRPQRHGSLTPGRPASPPPLTRTWESPPPRPPNTLGAPNPRSSLLPVPPNTRELRLPHSPTPGSPRPQHPGAPATPTHPTPGRPASPNTRVPPNPAPPPPPHPHHPGASIPPYRGSPDPHPGGSGLPGVGGGGGTPAPLDLLCSPPGSRSFCSFCTCAGRAGGA